MFKVLAKSLCLFFMFCQSSIGTEVSDEKKWLIDELLEAQGANFVGEEIAQGLAAQLEGYLTTAGIEVKEDFYQVIVSVISEVIYEEYVATGELSKLHYETWGEYFSSSEIVALTEFYQSALGQKLLDFMPQLTERSTMTMLEVFQRVQPLVEERLGERLTIDEIGLNSLTADLAKRRENTERFPVENPPSAEELFGLAEEKCAQFETSGKRTPIYRGPPTYPRAAAENSLQGFVDLSFTVNKDGSTSDVRAYKSSNGSVFDRAAIAAVENYLYCPGNITEDATIRVRFEMEKQLDDQKIENDAPTFKADDLGFLESDTFISYVQTYAAKGSRKAFSIAYDGENSWVADWSYNLRTQEQANNLVLNTCEERKRKKQIKSACELVLIGEQPTERFKSSTKFVDMVRSLHAGSYEPKNQFERYVDDYGDVASPKALAIVEEPSGAFYTAQAHGLATQLESNEEALRLCNTGKPEDIDGQCELYMIGDYRAKNVPQLQTMRGIWTGTLTGLPVGGNASSRERSQFDVRLDNCGQFPVIATRDSALDEFVDFALLFDVSEKSGNVVLSSLVDGGSWVETQVWAFTDLQNGMAAAQQNRLVSNVEIELDDPERSFGYVSSGSLTKLDERCSATQEK